MTIHNFPPDRFGLCFKTPLGNIVDEAEANRIAQLALDKERAIELREHPPERPVARLRKIKETICQ